METLKQREFFEKELKEKEEKLKEMQEEFEEKVKSLKPKPLKNLNEYIKYGNELIRKKERSTTHD